MSVSPVLYPWAAEAGLPPRRPVVRLHHEAFAGAVDPETADSDNSGCSYPGGRVVLNSRKLSTFGEAVCYLRCVMLLSDRLQVAVQGPHSSELELATDEFRDVANGHCHG